MMGYVRLPGADGDRCCTALRQRLRDEVFELAGLVATERDSRVAVLTFGPDLDLAAEVGTQPRQRMDRRRPERERIAREVVERHVRIVSTAAMWCASASIGRHR